MARPQKNNADYFPHDAGMRNDPKVRALRARYGLEAYAVWCILLETLTDADNFCLVWDDLNRELIAGDIGIDPQRLTDIVDYMQRIQLIQIDPQTQQLYTSRHRERMLPIIEARERKRQWKQENNPKATTKTAPAAISDGENTQSKVKETKVNKTKEEREENAPAPNEIEIEKNHDHDAYTYCIAAINDWARPDNWQPLRDYAASVGYDPAQYGPVADEVKKFTTHWLDLSRVASTDRAAFIINPAQFFQDKARKWLLDAKTFNKPKKRHTDHKPKYQPPPPHQPRTNNGNATPTTIGNIAGKIITEIA